MLKLIHPLDAGCSPDAHRRDLPGEGGRGRYVTGREGMKKREGQKAGGMGTATGRSTVAMAETNDSQASSSSKLLDNAGPRVSVCVRNTLPPQFPLSLTGLPPCSLPSPLTRPPASTPPSCGWQGWRSSRLTSSIHRAVPSGPPPVPSTHTIMPPLRPSPRPHTYHHIYAPSLPSTHTIISISMPGCSPIILSLSSTR